MEAEVAYCGALNPHELVPTAAVGTATRGRCANHMTAEITDHLLKLSFGLSFGSCVLWCFWT